MTRSMSRHWFVVDWQCSLGAGGEGEVFLGRSLETWELCAVKVSSLLDRALAKEQLAGELERCSRAAGDGVVGLIGWNLDAPRPFLVFELAHAGTLADEMQELRKQARTYHPVAALSRGREILQALAHLHARGLVHRDVKPANLLRFPDGIKITDFGAGRSIANTSALESEAFVGTRAYAAPEQLSGDSIDDRSDLYAVGSILHEMLTGALPARRARRPSYPNSLVLPELHDLLDSFLAEEVSRRPACAADALRRVDSVLESYARARRVWSELRLGPSPY
jgi:eukaryotic-like serine/threonine-protein kinase